MNKKWINSALNCVAYSSFEGVSQHCHSKDTSESLCRNTTQTIKTTHYDWSLRNNRNISDKYTIALRNKFDAIQEIFETPTTKDEYENFVNVHAEAAAECIPTKLSDKHRIPWETFAVRKKKRDKAKT